MKLQLIFNLFSKKEKRQLIIVLFALLIMGFIELIGIGSIGPFISIITNPSIIHSNTYLAALNSFLGFSSDNEFIVFFGIAVIIVLALSNLCLSGVNLLIYYYSGKRRHSFSMRLFERYIRQQYVFFLDTNSAILLRNMENVNIFASDILINLLNLISGIIISFCIIILLIVINPFLALIISSFLGISYLGIFHVVKNILARKGAEKHRINILRYKYLNEAFGGIKDIKILCKERTFLDLYREPSLKYSVNDAIGNSINDLPRYLIETLAIGGMILVIIFMVHSGAKLEQFLPLLTIYVFGAYRLLPLLQKIFRAFATIRYHYSIVENLDKDFNSLPEGARLVNDDTLSKLEFTSSIALNNITFLYPNSGKTVIDNVSLKIKHNTSIAFAGSTGCGKTTLADIILCLLVPQKGEIVIDNTKIDESNRHNWQKNLGYVPQSIYLTDDTIRNNIAFGVHPEKIDDEAIRKAAKLANIDDFISNELPEKYDTVIGEHGVRLSGGQRQRIGIARAVYHDPSVLIFDEATSALDSLTENAIMEAINSMSHKKTIIIIAHRITTIKDCDCIYLMDKGTITDSGNFNDLYEKNPVFRKMAEGS
jgi:ABC-type multidrug transport system fused ATPase/permease subunit